MKLLFDQNVSPKLVGELADLFPNSQHVQGAGLHLSSDLEVWEYARHNDFAIVTKDEDYSVLSVSRGYPPKVIWLQLGNCTTAEISAVLRDRLTDIEAFEAVPTLGTLVLN